MRFMNTLCSGPEYDYSSPWTGGAMDSVLDFESSGCGFESRPVHCPQISKYIFGICTCWSVPSERKLRFCSDGTCRRNLPSEPICVSVPSEQILLLSEANIPLPSEPNIIFRRTKYYVPSEPNIMFHRKQILSVVGTKIIFLFRRIVNLFLFCRNPV